MQPPLALSEPAIVRFLGVVDQLDSAGWDELVRIGRASAKQLRTLPARDAASRLPDLPDVLAEPDREGSAFFEGTNLPAEYAGSVVRLHRRVKACAVHAYGAARPIESSDDETGEPAADIHAGWSEAWSERMDKATRLAAQGAALLALSGCRPAWDDLWAPWKAWLQSRPPFNLFRGSWSQIVELGPRTAEAPDARHRAWRPFRRSSPDYGPGTPEVLRFLTLIPEITPESWERLHIDAHDFLTTVDWADGAEAHVLQTVLALTQAMAQGQRWLVDSEGSRLNGELADLAMSDRKPPLMRTAIAAGRVCVDRFGAEPPAVVDDRRLAASCCALLLAARPWMPAVDWETIWGGPLR